MKEKIMLQDDVQLLQNMFRIMPRKIAIVKLIIDYGWEQDQLVNALRAYGVPTRVNGNKVYFSIHNQLYTISGIREMAEKILSDCNFDFVEITCST